MINENYTPSRQNSISRSPATSSGRRNCSKGASSKKELDMSADVLDLMEDISGLQHELNSRRQTFEGGADALHELLDNSYTSNNNSIVSEDASKSTKKFNRRSTADPSDLQSLLGGLDSDIDDVSVQNDGDNSFSSPHQHLSSILKSFHRTPESTAANNVTPLTMTSTHSMASQSHSQSLSVNVRKSPRLASAEKSLIRSVEVKVTKSTGGKEKSKGKEKRRETVAAEDLASIMNDLNDDDDLESQSISISHVNYAEEVTGSVANPRSRRQTFEGGMEALQNLLDNSKSSFVSEEEDTNNFSYSLSEESQATDNTSLVSGGTLCPAELGSLLDIDEGNNINDKYSNDDSINIVTDVTDATTSFSAIESPMTAVENIRSLSITSTPINVLSESRGGHSQPNRRETVDPADLALIMSDLEGESDEDIYAKKTTRETSSSNRKSPSSARRMTADPQDMLAMLAGLEEEEHELALQTRGKSQASSASKNSLRMSAIKSGRESIDTIALMQSVANILDDLDEDTNANRINNDDAVSELSSISGRSSVRKFRVYHSSPSIRNKPGVDADADVGLDLLDSVSRRESIASLSMDDGTVHTMDLINQVNNHLHGLDNFIADSGNNDDDDDDDDNNTVSSYGSICGLLNQINDATVTNPTSTAHSNISGSRIRSPMETVAGTDNDLFGESQDTEQIAASQLKSCISSRKSVRKSVIFGSPNVAEFNKSSPTTNYTPLTKAQSRVMFPAAGHTPMHIQQENEDYESEGESLIDELTAENEQILEEWDRLTNASSAGSDDDFDGGEDMIISASNSPAAKSSTALEAFKRGLSPGAAASPSVGLLDSKKARRRRSMLQPQVDLDQDLKQCDASFDCSFNEDNEVADAGDNINQSLASNFSEASQTVALPANMADLLMSMNDVPERPFSHSIRPKGSAVKIDANTSVVSCGEDQTQELEMDLQSLMRRVNYARISIEQPACLDSSRDTSVYSERSDVSGRSKASQRSTASDATGASERSLNTLLGNTLLDCCESPAVEGSDHNNNNSLLSETSMDETDDDRIFGRDTDKNSSYLSVNASFESHTIQLEGKLSDLFEKITSPVGLASPSPSYICSHVDGSLVEDHQSCYNDGASLLCAPPSQVELSFVKPVEEVISVPAQPQTTVSGSDGKATDILSKLRSLNADARQNALSQACGNVPASSVNSSRLSMGPLKNRQSILQAAAAHSQSAQKVQNPLRLSISQPLLAMPAVAPSTAMMFVNLPAAIIEEEDSQVVLPSLSFEALLCKSGLPIIRQDNDNGRPYKYSSLSIESFIDAFMQSQHSDTAFVGTITGLFADIIKAAVGEVETQASTSLSSIDHLTNLWDAAKEDVKTAFLLKEACYLSELTSQSCLLTDHNWLLWETRLMMIATEAIEKYTQSTQAQLEETRQKNMSRATEIETMMGAGQQRKINELQMKQQKQTADIESLRRALQEAKSEVDHVDVKSQEIKETQKNELIANISSRMINASSSNSNVTAVVGQQSRDTSHVMSVVQSEAVSDQRARLAELHRSHSIINRLSYCRVVSYSTAELAVEAVLTSQFRVLFTVKFNGPDAEEAKPYISDIMVDVELRGPPEASRIKENLLAQSYFVNVMCANDLAGPFSGRVLSPFKYPNQIPNLLMKVSGYVAILRQMMESLNNLFGNQWTVDGADVVPTNTATIANNAERVPIRSFVCPSH